jgi:hypothetical protein
MRLEERAAVAMGVLLPILETYRRGIGHWRVDFTTMFEDYFAGVLLIAGAWAGSRRPAFGVPLLLVAWAWVTGMFTNSFVGQVEETIRGVDLEPLNTEVLCVKAILLTVATAVLTATVRRLRADRQTRSLDG